jgi:hypothetical protein
VIFHAKQAGARQIYFIARGKVGGPMGPNAAMMAATMGADSLIRRSSHSHTTQRVF